jgi:BirA family biotin operon repressor/biotin-[acetyl-CoA-carboxylase] ligase
MTTFLARHERFDRVGSTNDVVRDWLANGTPEVCLAVADEQTAGRGRGGRAWVAPRGAAVILSLGFRPTWLEPDRVWRLSAVVSLAMAEAAEVAAGLPDEAVRLKWPNDLVIESVGSGVRKIAGILGETQGLGTADPRAVIGLGINTSWAAADFPPDLVEVMTSLEEATDGRAIDGPALLADFLARLEGGIDRLRSGAFDADRWSARQITTGRTIRLERPDAVDVLRATGVDPATGALVVESPDAPNGTRNVVVGDVTHVRLATSAPVGV